MTDESTKYQNARTPLSDLEAAMTTGSNEEVSLKEAPLCGQVTIRAKPDNAAALQAFKQATGLDLPLTANTFSSNDSYRVFWMGPSEWLLTTATEDATGIMTELGQETSGMNVALVDVSDNRTRLVLSGNAAWTVLNKTCAMDLHPKSWQPEQCAQTLVGRTQVLLAMTSDNPVEFQLFARNSFAAYLAEFLLEAMREFAKTASNS